MNNQSNVLDDKYANDVYEYLVTYMASVGFAPSRREISEKLDISGYDVSKAIKKLEVGGYIKREKRKPRAIRLCHYKLVEKL